LVVVDIFFVISGFVIALTLFSEMEIKGRVDNQRYIKRRIFRIAPLHYLTCLLFMVMVVPNLLIDNVVPNVLSHLFFFHNFWPSLHGAVNGSNWSVATEVQFYLFILLTVSWMYKASIWRLALILISISWIWRILVLFLMETNGMESGHLTFIYTTQLPGMLDEFGLGIILARLLLLKKFQRIINQRWALILFSCVTVLLIVVTQNIYWSQANYWSNHLMVVGFKTLLGLSAMSLLLTFVIIPDDQRVSNLLYPLRYLGTISYGIYLWHLPVLLSIKKITWLSNREALVYIIVVTIVLSVLSWHYFEKPFIARAKR